jgi:hypothetical protein
MVEATWQSKPEHCVASDNSIWFASKERRVPGKKNLPYTNSFMRRAMKNPNRIKMCSHFQILNLGYKRIKIH